MFLGNWEGADTQNNKNNKRNGEKKQQTGFVVALVYLEQSYPWLAKCPSRPAV